MYRKLYAEDIAQAMELRSVGVSWKTMAYYLGHKHGTLRDGCRNAKRRGFAAYPMRSP